MSRTFTSSVSSDCSYNSEEECCPNPPLRSPLPDSKIADGRPVWESPIFSYDELIGKEYEQKRKAYLKYTNGDVAKATEMLDTSIEYLLLIMHHEWIEENWDRTIFETQDRGGEGFFRALYRAVGMEGNEIRAEWMAFRVIEERKEDGTWEIMSHAEFDFRAFKCQQVERHGGLQQSFNRPIPDHMRSLDDIFQAVFDTSHNKVEKEATNIPEDTDDNTKDSSLHSSVNDNEESAPATFNLLNLWW